ncbi:hypothetical protein CQ010_17675 [Arthrobacter sp. MYb211]|uniref:DUF5129 domain-containing protein n=1 Tax=unclassified Arthrobacter TaxID=235627 RepID=UPI000CFCE59C|nr:MULTISPECIES: DUF5129 domain-containing protein [unclassified Arthrobacter]PRA08352.1 hypothetical protein CQ015_17660 [Arthrobacter sp. MYb221]PRC03766.1 hypothetical protein CQ010_17675 [Arthrobacter sp. MYb211]
MRQLNSPRRALAAAAAATLLFLAVPPAAQAEGINLDSITIDDTANVLNEQKLRDAVGEIDFNEPTKVAVYSREGQYADDINSQTLGHARSAHPEWISADPEDYGDYWANGYFIITLSVEGPGDGQIGTYFGEDRKVSDSQIRSIHEAGSEDFNQARWTDGVVAVAARGANIINRPWYRHPALGWTVGLGSLGAIGGTGIALAVRSGRRKSFAEQLESGSAHLTNVTMDLDATELSARTLPGDSHHAAELERRFADFAATYRACFTTQQELAQASKKLRSSSPGVARAKEFHANAQALDLTDDAINDAAALYTRGAAWEDAWRRQTAPLLEDLTELPALIEDAPEELQAQAAALDSYSATAKRAVADLGNELKAEKLDVDTALDKLSELRSQLTERLDAYASAQVEVYASSAEEKQEMHEALRHSRYDSTGASRSGSILDVIYPASMFWRVNSYNAGYATGVNAVDTSREAASSSGVSHGYSGGGSFSGAGGSSRF